MKLRQLSKQKWFNGAVIACIGVAFYVILTHLSPILHALWHFLGNFKSIFVGIVFAYVINPVAKFFYYRLFTKMALGQKRWALSVLLAFLTGFLALAFLMVALVPQLIQSILLFSSNFESYANALSDLLVTSGLGAILPGEQLQTLTGNALDAIQSFVVTNAGAILNSAANSGRQILSTVISLILAIFFLLNKKTALNGVRRLLRAFLRQEVRRGMTLRPSHTSEDVLRKLHQDADRESAAALRKVYIQARYDQSHPVSHEQVEEAREALRHLQDDNNAREY